jgi:hypothetical protein
MDLAQMKPNAPVVERFHRTLVEEICRDGAEKLDRPFTVAEIYQSLVPYRTHRDRIGVEMNGDYEDALLRLLAGEGEYVVLDSDSARDRIRRELEGSNPNTGLYREFAALEVRLNPERLPPDLDRSQTSLEGMDRAGDGTGSGPPESPGLLDPDPASTADEKAASSPAPGHTPKAPASRVQAGKPGEARTGKGLPAGPRPGSCPECGKGLPERESLRFCPFCGANPFTVECSACGEELDRNWKFCISCGTPSRG